MRKNFFSLFKLLSIAIHFIFLQFALLAVSHAEGYYGAYSAMAGSYGDNKKNPFVEKAAMKNPEFMAFLLEKNNKAKYRCSTQKTAVIDHQDGIILVHDDGRFESVKYAEISGCFHDENELVSVRERRWEMGLCRHKPEPRHITSVRQGAGCIQ